MFAQCSTVLQTSTLLQQSDRPRNATNDATSERLGAAQHHDTCPCHARVNWAGAEGTVEHEVLTRRQLRGLVTDRFIRAPWVDVEIRMLQDVRARTPLPCSASPLPFSPLQQEAGSLLILRDRPALGIQDAAAVPLACSAGWVCAARPRYKRGWTQTCPCHRMGHRAAGAAETAHKAAGCVRPPIAATGCTQWPPYDQKCRLQGMRGLQRAACSC